MTFPKTYLRTIWYSKSLSSKFDVTMATTFCKRFFQNFEFPKSKFLEHFKFLERVLVNLLIFSTLDQFGGFEGFGKIKKFKLADPRWLPFANKTLL